MTKPRIVIVGGGFAGAFTAHELRRHGGYEVALELIDPKNHFVFQPLLPEVAGGAVNALDTVTPLRQMLRGGSLRTGVVRDVDFTSKRVEVAQGTGGTVVKIPYDHLVLAPGLGTDLSAFPGLEEHAFPLKSALDAHALRNHVISCLEQASMCEDHAERHRLLTFVVAGAGLSGVEVLGEIHDLVRRSLRYYPVIRPGDVRIELIEYGPSILSELDDDLAEKALGVLRARGVAVRTSTPVREASARSITVGDGTVIPTATIIATIGNAPTDLAKALPLPKDKGRLVVDGDLRVRGHSDVWALGDAAMVPTEDGFAPPTAQAAVKQAKLLARNIVAATEGKHTQAFRYRSKGTLASLGGRRGVANVRGTKLSGRTAWLLWRLVHLRMLPRGATRWRVAFEQFLDLFLPRTAVLTGEPPVQASRFVRHRAGDLAFGGHSVGKGAFLIVEGRYVAEGPGQEARTLGPGDHFGAVEAMEAEPTEITVRALEASRALQVAPDELHRLIEALAAAGNHQPLQEIRQEIEDARATAHP